MGMLEDALREYAAFDDRTGDPATPATDVALVYVKDGVLHTIDDQGAVTAYGEGGGAGNPTTVDINTETSSYTLVLADAGKVVRMNSGTAVDLTVPAEASVDFPLATIIEVRQVGEGTVTVVEDTGVTVNIEAGLTLDLRGQYASVSLHKVGADTWDGVGGFAEAT